jgi:hypothetical protein
VQRLIAPSEIRQNAVISAWRTDEIRVLAISVLVDGT